MKTDVCISLYDVNYRAFPKGICGGDVARFRRKRADRPSDWTAKHSAECLAIKSLPHMVRRTQSAAPIAFATVQFPARIERGGAYRDRTDDPLLAKQVLSQLS